MSNDSIIHCMLYFPFYISQLCGFVISILLWRHYGGSYASSSRNNDSNIFIREMKKEIAIFFSSCD